MSVNRNISLYLYYRAAADGFAWLPVFFLYFSQRLSLAEVLLLESVYYVAIVVTEVPSGYLSDVIGRRTTLLIAAASVMASYVFFLASDSFVGLALGQCLLAAGSACRSGTDTALHYESLAALSRADEYGDREALAGRIGFFATSVAALAGGILGSVDLAWPYWYSLMAASITLVVVYLLVEPGHQIKPSARVGFIVQLGQVIRYWRNPTLAWLFAYFVVMYAIVHVPYEFYQPYLKLLQGKDQLGGLGAPVISGVIFALTALVGSWVAGRSMAWQRRLGLMRLLNIAAIVELFVVAGLAIVLHPALAALVLLRNGPMAVIGAPIRATIAPMVKDSHRATYLSLQSLVARLGFSALLLLLANVVSAGELLTWAMLSTVLRIALALGAISLIVLWISGRRIRIN